MKINKLILHHCIRLELSGIEHLELDFKEIGSLLSIIGSNGSGKSSLLHYLSPLPAEKNDFHSTGYKEIHLEHLGVEYCLRNDYRNNKHSFYQVNTEEELNIGGTITYQYQLVKDYFSYTKEIHALLTGKELFTAFSPQKRKDWFTLLCDTDYRFALKVFTQAKEKLRDSVGAYKKSQQQLIALEQAGLGTEHSEEINLRIQEKEAEIRELEKVASFKPGYHQPNYLKEQLGNYKQVQEKLLKYAKETHSLAQQVHLAGIEDIQLEIEQENEEKKQQYVLKQILSEKTQHYTQVENKLLEIQQSLNLNLTEIKEKIALLEKEEKQYQVQKWVEYPKALLSRINQEKQEIHSLIEESRRIESLNLSSSYLAKLTEDLEKDKHQFHLVALKESKIEERIQNILEKENQAKIQCPQCQHEFHYGYSKEKLARYREVLASCRKEKSLLKKNLTQLENTVSSLQRDLDALKRLLIKLSSYEGLFSKLIPEIKQEKLYQSGTLLHDKVEEQIHLLKDWVRIEEIIEEKTQLQSQLERATGVDERYREDLETERVVLEKEILETRDKLELSQAKLDSLSKRIHLHQVFHDYQKHLTEEIEIFDSLSLEIAEKALYDSVQSLITCLREEVSVLSKKHLSLLNQETQLKLLRDTLSSLEEEKLAYTAITEALNPQDGLIAEGLLGYIKRFLARMNGLIATIWTYPLIIHPSKHEGENLELSYRFPLTVGQSKSLKPDVSVGSDGIREVIDLAFKIMVMHALHIRDYPLYLDEFGRTFDAKHRENAMKLIEKLSEEFPDNQIFLISHSFMEYSVLSDIVYCVLSEDNIVLPPQNLNRGITILRNEST